MTDSKANSVSVRVSKNTYDSMDEERDRIKLATRRRPPTFTALLDKAWWEHMGRKSSESGTTGTEQSEKDVTKPSQVNESQGILSGISEEDRTWIAQLQLLKESGDPIHQSILNLVETAAGQISGREPIVTYEAPELSPEERLARALEDAKKLKHLNPHGGEAPHARPPKRRAG